MTYDNKYCKLVNWTICETYHNEYYTSNKYNKINYASKTWADFIKLYKIVYLNFESSH